MRYRSIKGAYRSGRDNLTDDFFAPCFESCISYNRAVGFFTSTALRTWAGGLSRFPSGGLKIKLLVGPFLSDEDKNAIREAHERPKDSPLQDIADEFLLRAFRFSDGKDEERLWLFRQMLETGRLEIRIAFTESEEGIYHEKIGYFEFPNGDWLAFDGSANESGMAHQKNYERFHVFRSWELSDVERGQGVMVDFDEAWRGEAEGLDVYEPSPSVLNKVKGRQKNDTFKISARNRQSFDKWIHQEKALEAFIAAGRGVLEMATGTGKTKTALKIVRRLISEEKIDSVVISLTGSDLLSQWYEELVTWTSLESLDWPILRQDQSFKELDVFTVLQSPRILLVSRTMLHRLSSYASKGHLRRSIIIQDEVHGLGSPDNRIKLAAFHQQFGYTLGLSATPEREYDQEGSDFIETEIGSVFFRFGLEDAIRKGILTEMDYVCLPYFLSENERRKISKIFSFRKTEDGGNYSQEDIWRMVAAVYKSAESKIDEFDKYLKRNPGILKRAIIFVSDTRYGEQVMELLHQYSHNYKGYFSGETHKYLDDFANKQIDTLVTCHRLSQGIDISDVSAVILFASDRAKLETIQRIGRCLRIDPKNPNKRATVLDFILEADKDTGYGREADEDRKDWLMNIAEVRRDD